MAQRQLTIIRHAKAGDGPVDRDRALTGRGRRDAAAAGAWLAGQGWSADLALVSPALRAVQTWDAIAAGLPAPPPVAEEEALYDNTVGDVLDAIGGVAAGVRHVVVVGHNPSLERLAQELDDGSGPAGLRHALAEGLKTCTIARFDVGTAFTELAAGVAVLRGLHTARA